MKTQKRGRLKTTQAIPLLTHACNLLKSRFYNPSRRPEKFSGCRKPLSLRHDLPYPQTP
ncbi:hypothetical protein NEIMUCOT_04841 [Neisseria mucosa ATCC 25996]|uniref:Uncharacterized protein n=1 Tax=Neisseria mucosa (strain ATCC 25996 / DSM 4631 / NCTC 10774 / M26) TaxID=546266 RepID=D2ZW48_NEIM2|nr:hypothetical protein NEIMUCOT_04841 [Neisseria mucosa ATCC 25996]